jgi:hypothetical protein
MRSKTEIRKTIPFIAALKRIKYYKINERSKRLYTKNNKTTAERN